jgi:hypothetical protein
MVTRPGTLDLMVFTTCSSGSEAEVLESYCMRRQIELVFKRFSRLSSPFRTIIGYEVCHVDVDFYDRFYNPHALPDAVQACTERALRKT